MSYESRVHPFTFIEPFSSTNMSRSSSRSRQSKASSASPTFYANTTDSIFAREKLMEEPFRYFSNVSYLRKPAEVTDALRASHPRLAVYDRNSMKGGIARMLRHDQEIIQRVTGFFGTNGGGGNNGQGEETPQQEDNTTATTGVSDGDERPKQSMNKCK